ncbi:MAG: helix-turn-helix transcriptional regulator [Kiritimatiellae bacterium]|nr:helix-turn-helix transcriptional regulator [Kiritimatiellia bacterium]
MVIKNIPALIRDRIEEKGMTVKATAAKAGLSPQALSAMLSSRQKISATAFISLCGVLELTPEQFIETE